MSNSLIDSARYGIRLIRMLDYDKHTRLGPIRVDIAASSACNYKCYFCNAHSPVAPGSHNNQHMNRQVLGELLSSLAALKTRNILFAGDGEPLLNPCLTDVIIRYGPHFNIELLTNGSTLGLVRQDLFERLSKLTISLNAATDSTHQKIHGYPGEPQYQRIYEHIERILRYPKAQEKITINYVVTRDNVGEIPEHERNIERWGVHSAVRNMAADYPAMEKWLVDEPGGAEETLSPCYNGFIQPFITSNGDVLVCPDSSERPMGNLHERSFEQIWRDPESLKLRMEAVRMEQPLCPVCPGCANAQLQSKTFHRIYSKIKVGK